MNNSTQNSTPAAEPAGSEWLDTFSFICSILIIIICIMGACGNTLSATVFLQSQLRKLSINISLAALSFADLFLLLFAIPVYSTAAIAEYFSSVIELRDLNTFALIKLYPLTHIFHCTAVWLLAAITIERWLAVSKPLIVQRFCTRQRAIVLVLTILTAAVLFNMSRFWEFQAVEGYELTLGLRTNEDYMLWYAAVAHTLFVGLIPLLILVVFNSRIAVEIVRSQKTRKQMTSAQRTDHGTSRMLLYVVLCFIVCYSMAVTLDIVEYIRPDYFETPIAWALSDVCNMLGLLNAATTCFFYWHFSSKYRRTAIGLLARTFCIGDYRDRLLIKAEASTTLYSKMERQGSKYSTSLSTLSRHKSMNEHMPRYQMNTIRSYSMRTRTPKRSEPNYNCTIDEEKTSDEMVKQNFLMVPNSTETSRCVRSNSENPAALLETNF